MPWMLVLKVFSSPRRSFPRRSFEMTGVLDHNPEAWTGLSLNSIKTTCHFDEPARPLWWDGEEKPLTFCLACLRCLFYKFSPRPGAQTRLDRRKKILSLRGACAGLSAGATWQSQGMPLGFSHSPRFPPVQAPRLNQNKPKRPAYQLHLGSGTMPDRRHQNEHLKPSFTINNKISKILPEMGYPESLFSIRMPIDSQTVRCCEKSPVEIRVTCLSSDNNSCLKSPP